MLSSSPEVQQLLASYTDICRAAAGADAGSDEFLYGRAGTLFGALLLRQQLAAAAVPDEVVAALAHSMQASGKWGFAAIACSSVQLHPGRATATARPLACCTPAPSLQAHTEQ